MSGLWALLESQHNVCHMDICYSGHWPQATPSFRVSRVFLGSHSISRSRGNLRASVGRDVSHGRHIF